MTREQLLELCKQAPAIGAVRHEEFVDYFTTLDQVRRVNGKWERTEAAYMSVDGRVTMANEDHRRQGKSLHFEDPVILVDDDQQLTLLVAINSELYGRRHGIATSRRVGGSTYEMAHPWEVAETSAIGRALASMGYGVLPGSGLASADDVTRAREAEGSQPPSRTRLMHRMGEPRRGQRPVTAFQEQKITELFRELYPSGDVRAGVDAIFQREVGYPLADATYDEGRKVTALLLRERRQVLSQASGA